MRYSHLIEPLESRIAPATIFVTNIHDDGVGSLRVAIEKANATPGPDLIKFRLRDALRNTLFHHLETAGNDINFGAPVISQVNAHQPIVVCVALAMDQLGIFHALEHGGDSCPLDAERIGDLGLRHALYMGNLHKCCRLSARHTHLINKGACKCMKSLGELSQHLPVQHARLLQSPRTAND